MRKENLIQGAISASLEVYCDRNNIHADVFEPYPNQQGHKVTQYCADLLALLDHSRLLLLEVKELEVATPNKPAYLPSYDAYQHYLAWRLEELNAPILYGYAATSDLSYFASPRSKQWPNTTLQGTSTSRPSTLFRSKLQQSQKRPDRQNHDDLLSWILKPPRGAGHLLANIVALSALTTADLRNANLLVLCNYGSTIVPNLSPDAIELLLNADPFRDFDPLHPQFDEVRSTLLESRQKAADSLAPLRRYIDQFDIFAAKWLRSELPKRRMSVPDGKDFDQLVAQVGPQLRPQIAEQLIGHLMSLRNDDRRRKDREPSNPDRDHDRS